ncbi:MAG: Rpn family recombination-promoting nuclease/putative transposase [Coxiellaceae bacterium]|nr:Rpn family recombination-promoting nuclease/putative transposase [Coxiellaceae bacterium]
MSVMVTDVHQPHDGLFQQAMKNITVARDFFEAHLPQSLQKRIDLSQLRLEKKSFIDDRSQRLESDIIYSLKIDEESSIYFYLLCEHQSRVDPDMPYRLLRYQMRLMEQHRAQHPKSDLPIIYPMVLYSGKSPWNKSRSLFDYYGEQAELAKSLWSAPFQLIDLHRVKDDELQKHQLSGLMEFALKNKKVRDFRKFLQRLLPWLDQVNIEDDQERLLKSCCVTFY